MKSALNLMSSQEIVRDKSALSCDVLYISECSVWGEFGHEMVSTTFHSVLPVYWSPGIPKPNIDGWHGDWIISFKSDLVLPPALLARARKGAINFHPSPHRYRGVGGYWWALQNGDDTFGVTCHHMNDRIDHGEIIKTESFHILERETVESLRNKAALYSLKLLNEVLDDIAAEKPLTPCGIAWESHLYTYRELALAQEAKAQRKLRPSVASVAAVSG